MVRIDLIGGQTGFGSAVAEGSIFFLIYQRTAARLRAARSPGGNSSGESWRLASAWV